MKLSYTAEDKYGSITVTVEYEPTDDAVVEVLKATGKGDISGILINISNFDKWIDEIDWKSNYQQKKTKTMNEKIKLQKTLMMSAIAILDIYEESVKDFPNISERAINLYAETMATLASLIVPENQQSCYA